MIVLASASPRRLELLSHLGLPIVVRPADIDESVIEGELPKAYVRRLSIEKAATTAPRVSFGDLVIAADTTVEIDDQILGKPADDADAKSMLRHLSGRTHQVHTGVTVVCGDMVATEVVTTAVTFATLDDAAIDWYVATGEPFDKAGAYAIQGAGGAFVEQVDGSVSNVIGLPMTTVIDLARSVGFELLALKP